MLRYVQYSFHVPYTPTSNVKITEWLSTSHSTAYKQSSSDWNDVKSIRKQYTVKITFHRLYFMPVIYCSKIDSAYRTLAIVTIFFLQKQFTVLVGRSQLLRKHNNETESWPTNAWRYEDSNAIFSYKSYCLCVFCMCLCENVIVCGNHEFFIHQPYNCFDIDFTVTAFHRKYLQEFWDHRAWMVLFGNDHRMAFKLNDRKKKFRVHILTSLYWVSSFSIK